MKNLKEEPNAFENSTGASLRKLTLLLFTGFFLFGAAPVFAEEKTADETEYGFEVYLWMPTIQSTTATGDRVLITFGDIVKNLDFTAMIRGTVQSGRFFGAADMIYMGISNSQRHKGEFLNKPVTGKLKVGLDAWVLNFIGGYNLVDNGKDTFGITGGARYLDLTLDTTIKIEDAKTKDRTDNGSGWDGVVGVKGRHNYPDGHYLN